MEQVFSDHRLQGRQVTDVDSTARPRNFPLSWTVFSQGCGAVRINKSHKEPGWCVFLGGGLRALIQTQGGKEDQPLSNTLSGTTEAEPPRVRLASTEGCFPAAKAELRGGVWVE